MSAQTWDLVYGRPPFGRDAALFGLALALHLPLLFMQFKAPLKKGSDEGSLYRIQMREEAIERVMARTAVLPKAVPRVVTPRPLRDVVKAPVLPPVIPALPDRPVLPKVEPRTAPTINIAKLAAPPIATLPGPGAAGGTGGGAASISNLRAPGGPAPVGSEGASGIRGVAPAVRDRGTFVMPENTIGGIGGEKEGTVATGRGPIVNIPTGARGSAEATILTPNVGTGKTISPGRVFLDPQAGTGGGEGLASPRAGTVTSINTDLKQGGGDSLPVVTAPMRTSAQRNQALFPIHGALKDRKVLYQDVPEYPEWARKKGISSSVQLKFSVSPDGRVREDIELLRGSGFPDLDDLARGALLRWVFTPLPREKGNLVESGTIEFRFSVR